MKMIKLEDYKILKVNFSFDLRQLFYQDKPHLSGLDVTEYLNDLDDLTALSKEETDSFENEFQKWITARNIVDIYNYPERRVDQQSFIEFLENGRPKKVQEFQPLLPNSIPELQSIKYLITTIQTNDFLTEHLQPVAKFIKNNYLIGENEKRSELSFEDFINVCCIILNIMSEEMRQKLFLTSEHSNLLEKLYEKYVHEKLYKIYLKKVKGHDNKASNELRSTSKVKLSKIYRTFSEKNSTKEDYLKLLKLRKRAAFNIVLSNRGLRIERRVQGDEAESLRKHIENFFVEQLGIEYRYLERQEKLIPKGEQILPDFFENQVASVNKRHAFIQQWTHRLLYFFHLNYGVHDNRENGFSNEQLRIVWAFFLALNLIPSKLKTFKARGLKDWLNSFVNKEGFPRPTNLKTYEKMSPKKSPDKRKKPKINDSLTAY